MSLPLDRQCEAAGLPVPLKEVRFHPIRRWRFDFAFIGQRLAVEVEGGAWVAGRHTRGAGFQQDLAKYAEAAILGWTVLRVTPQHVANGQALSWIERLLKAGEN